MRVGTRGSALALAQARLVTQRIAPNSIGAGGLEVVVVNTSGDAPRTGERPGGDKSRWVAELEHALLAGDIDLAVHSAKDVPGELVDGLKLLGSPERAAAEDVLVGAGSIEQLPERGCVGTSSVRRTAQLLAARPDLEVVSLRGNVDTRLRKLASDVTGASLGRAAASGGRREPSPRERSERGQPRAAAEHVSGRAETAAREPGQFDAIVLAGAGLQRLGRNADIGCSLSVERFVPAPGQGALALQARADDDATRAIVAELIDHDATACLTAERTVAQSLGASCNTPLGAYAEPAGCGCLHLRAWVGLPDGSEWIADELVGGFYDPVALGQRMAERLQEMGGGQLLRRAEEMAVGGGQGIDDWRRPGD
jgi:hydroxymethylbilane synthase